MNKTLFFASLKANWKLLLGMFLLLLMYQSIIIGMYDPDNAAAMASMIELLPQALSSAFGYDVIATDLTGHIGAFMYGFLMLIFPLIYIVPAANNLVARHVDRGSIAYILATPVTRLSIARTQAVFLISSTAALLISLVITSILYCEIAFPGNLVYSDYLLLNLVTISVHLVLAGIAFFASCFFNESRNSLMLGLGVPLVFLTFQMMSGVSEKLEVLKNLTLFGLIDVYKIFGDHGYALIISAILLAVAFILIVISVRVFEKRNLNI